MPRECHVVAIFHSFFQLSNRCRTHFDMCCQTASRRAGCEFRIAGNGQVCLSLSPDETPAERVEIGQIVFTRNQRAGPGPEATASRQDSGSIPLAFVRLRPGGCVLQQPTYNSVSTGTSWISTRTFFFPVLSPVNQPRADAIGRELAIVFKARLIHVIHVIRHSVFVISSRDRPST